MKKITSIFCIILLSNCGFTVLKKQPFNFEIVEINMTGDKKINFKLRNNLLFVKNNNDKKLVKISLETKKEKTIKEKNSKNEITKYKINVTTNIKYEVLGDNAINQFSISEAGDYSVKKQHSQTINNEKNLIKILVEGISAQLLEDLVSNLNEL